ncbi:MAG: hypothetical protein ACOC7U_09660, partial [Spirochaetota bacterium]
MRLIRIFVIIVCTGAVTAGAAALRADQPEQARRMCRLFLEVEDGDTIVYMGRHMRFLGVDTPETRDPEVGIYIDQPYG